MKRLLMVLVLFTGLVVNGYCYEMNKTIENIVQGTDESSTLTVVSTNTLYSKSFPLINASKMAFIYKTTVSSGNSDVTINLLQSYQKPATEGYYNEGYVTTDTISTPLTDLNWHVATFDSITCLPYGVVQIIGNSGNSATTTLKMKIGKE